MESLSAFKNSNAYELSVRFSSDGFSFVVYDENGSVLSSKTVLSSLFRLSEREVLAILLAETETKLEFKKTRIICEFDDFTVIPAVFFKPEQSDVMLAFEHDLNRTDSVLFNQLPAFDAINIFSVPEGFYRGIQQVFPSIAIEHQVSFLLTDLVKKTSDDSLQIYVRSKMMDIVAISDMKLKLVNRFQFATPEDFMYHCLHVMELLSLHPNTCHIFLFQSVPNPELKNLLSKYVQFCTTADISRA